MHPPLPNSSALGSQPTGVAAASSGEGNAPKQYRVFLSYSHEDTKWARWLMQRLEGYRVPRRFHGRTAPVGLVGARLAPVFRDRDELPTTSDLGQTLEAALRASETLVVICSPASAKSRWVQAEIVAFKRLHGENRVFGFIVGGEAKTAGSADDCFSPALRAEVGADGELSTRPAEIVAADARSQGDGREFALMRLIAGLLGVGFDELRQRELARQRQRWAVTALAVAVVVGLSAMVWHARDAAATARLDAERRQAGGEELMAFLLDDVKTKLEKAEKLDAVEKAGARMMAYFKALPPDDLSDKTLAQHAKGLTQIGQIRIEQMRYADAKAALAAALERLEALVGRNPQNTEALFERGQAEFWTGFVQRRMGNIGEQAGWLRRYRDTSTALVALDPHDPRWQQELAYGQHNLAVIEVDAGQLAAARNGFLAELDILGKLAAAKPADLKLQNQIADANSWLGTVAEQSGDFGEAGRRFAEHVAGIEAIQRAESDNAKWKIRLTDALLLRASFLAITGEPVVAGELRGQGRALIEPLVKADPQNRTSRRLLLWLQFKDAEAAWAGGDLIAAEKLGHEVQDRLEQMLAREPQDMGLLDRLAVAGRLQAEVQGEIGRTVARASAERAVEFGERTMGDQHVRDLYVSDCALARITAGKLAAREGAMAAAQAHWKRALDLLRPRLAHSTHWRILFPAAQVLALLDRSAESRALAARLKTFGFYFPELRSEIRSAQFSPDK